MKFRLKGLGLSLLFILVSAALSSDLIYLLVPRPKEQTEKIGEARTDQGKFMHRSGLDLVWYPVRRSQSIFDGDYVRTQASRALLLFPNENSSDETQVLLAPRSFLRIYKQDEMIVLDLGEGNVSHVSGPGTNLMVKSGLETLPLPLQEIPLSPEDTAEPEPQVEEPGPPETQSPAPAPAPDAEVAHRGIEKDDFKGAPLKSYPPDQAVLFYRKATPLRILFKEKCDRLCRGELKTKKGVEATWSWAAGDLAASNWSFDPLFTGKVELTFSDGDLIRKSSFELFPYRPDLLSRFLVEGKRTEVLD